MLQVAVQAIAIFRLFVALADAQVADETAITPTGGLNAYVKRRGAEVRFYRSLGSGGKTGQITVKFSEMREVDVNGIGGSGMRKFNNFNNQDFIVSGESDVTLPNSVGGVMAKAITLDATLSDGGAHLTLQVYVIKTGGNLTLGDESSTVSEGQVKFTVEVRNWSWSTNGAFIEFDINVQIPPGKQMKEESDTSTDKKHPKRFSFGGGATASFSTKVQVDNGTWQNMASGYPKFMLNGANNLITLRLPRFNSSVLYDPTFDAGTDELSSPSKASFIIQPSLTLGILSCLVFMLRGAL